MSSLDYFGGVTISFYGGDYPIKAPPSERRGRIGTSPAAGTETKKMPPDAKVSGAMSPFDLSFLSHFMTYKTYNKLVMSSILVPCPGRPQGLMCQHRWKDKTRPVREESWGGGRGWYSGRGRWRMDWRRIWRQNFSFENPQKGQLLYSKGGIEKINGWKWIDDPLFGSISRRWFRKNGTKVAASSGACSAAVRKVIRCCSEAAGSAASSADCITASSTASTAC